MDAPAATEKDRVMVYLDPELGRLLRLERAETRRPISEIVEKLIRKHYGKPSHHRETAVSTKQ